jgi:hypothetical protein
VSDQDVVAIFAKLVSLETKMEQTLALNAVLLGRLTDTTHLSLAEIARFEDISKTAARNAYGRYLEEIPGTRRRGVPRQRVLDGWMSRRTIATAKRRQKASARS